MILKSYMNFASIILKNFRSFLEEKLLFYALGFNEHVE